jgi:AhpC/TSA family
MRRLAGLALAIFLAPLGCSSEPLQQAGDNAASPTGSAGSAGSAATPGPALRGTTFAEYPDGPYGTKRGSVIDNYAFLGWHAPLAAGYDTAFVETVRLSDFYNPGGTKSDVRLLVVNASAVWCTVCRAEYQHMHDNDVYATYRAKGVEILGTLFEDLQGGPSRLEDLTNWAGASVHQVEFPFVLDPGNKLGVFFSSDATPLNLLIDAHTMVVLEVVMGYSLDYWDRIDNTLAKL